jgi:hypothetical protein
MCASTSAGMIPRIPPPSIERIAFVSGMGCTVSFCGAPRYSCAQR